MRVLHVLNGEHRSGPERVVEHLVTRAREATPEVVALLDGDFAGASSIPVSTLRSASRLDVSVAPRLARLVRRRGIDIIHAHTPRANLVARLAGLMVGRPVVSHVHSPTWAEGRGRRFDGARAAIDDLTARLTTRHIAVSTWLRDQLVERGYPADRVDVCLNGVDVADIEARVAAARRLGPRADLGLPDGVLVIGMCAMFRPRKGADVLLRAFARSRTRSGGAILALVGGGYSGAAGSYLEELTRLAEQLGLTGQVRFPGFVRDTTSWMAAMDIAVLPALHGEGLPMALLEGLAAGLPTVATHTPGVDDVIDDGETGLLVQPGSEVELQDALDRLAEDPTLRTRLGTQAVLAARRFDADVMVAAVESSYQAVLRRRTRARSA